MTELTPSSAQSALMTKAILETTRAVGTLGKEGINEHGNYKFVGIDKFYQTVARIAAENGLRWTLRESEMQARTDLGKNGALMITYEVDVIHESGLVAKGWSRITVFHPIQGAQTVGSALSYADKCVMRQLFAVATGEKDIDADETDNRALDYEAPREKPRAETPKRERSSGNDNAPRVRVNDGGIPVMDPPGEEANYEIVERIFEGWISDVQSLDALSRHWGENDAALQTTKENAPNTYKRIVGMFTARKEALKRAAKKEQN